MRMTLAALAMIAAFALGGAAAQAQELLTNGNLDTTYQQLIVDNDPPGPGMEDFFLPKPDGWVNEGTRAITGPYEDELSSETWAGPAPTPVTVDDYGVFFKGFTGNEANGAATGHLYQDVPATPGTPYILRGWAGAEPNFMAAGAEIALEFLDSGGAVIGGDVVDLLSTLFVDNGEAFDYKQYSATATAPAGTVMARARASMIGGTPNPAGGGQAFVVDDFSLQVVPEPSSLVLVGIAIAALRMRRRAR